MTRHAVVIGMVLVGMCLAEGLGGQTDERARPLYRSLFDLSARQESHFSRYGRYNPVPDRDAPDSVGIVILQADATGWSAIAFDRPRPGIRCAIAVGPVQHPLGGEASSFPFCVRDDGRPIPSEGFQRDPELLYWGFDGALTVRPRALECPRLRVVRRPETNDTLYLEFVVNRDGRVEPNGVRLESSGTLEWSMAALARLEGCRYRPASWSGVPVRSLVREILPLAPDLSRLPRQPPQSAEPPPGGRVAQRPLAALRSGLEALRTLQDSVRAREATFARGVPDSLGKWMGGHVVLMSVTDTGWSAVAVHDSLGDIRCVAAGGVGPYPVPWGDANAVECRHADGRPIPRPDPGLRGVVAPLDEPPERIGCDTDAPLRGNARHRARVTLRFVVGLDGRAEPRSVVVLESPGLLDAVAAVEVISECRYRPGRVAGREVRVWVSQTVNFN